MGLKLIGDFETHTDLLLDSIYVRIEQFYYARPLHSVTVSVNYYESAEQAKSAWPVQHEDGNDISSQLNVSMSYNENWSEWPTLFEFDISKPVDVVTDIFEKSWATASIEYTDFDEDGNQFTGLHTAFEEVDLKIGEEVVTKQTIDTTELETNSFGFIYSLIKNEYTNIVGEVNVIDE